MSDNFYGMATRVLENNFVRVEYLTDAGPRIVRVFVKGAQGNLLAELPDKREPTPFGDYVFRGGHRLWHAPEAKPRSYIPDNAPMQIDEIANGVRLTQATEVATGIRKSIELELDANAPTLTLRHALRNEGQWRVELAPWALTMLQLGGTVIFPQRMTSVDEDRLLPNRQIVLWQYTRVRDSRLDLRDDYVLLHAKPAPTPLKIGYMNDTGWVGYVRAGIFFRKTFEPQPDAPHVDFGCNAETYACDEFVELETLGPLAHIEPGESVTHTETWEFFTDLNAPSIPDIVREVARL
jgi:hypothetical protein